jgi:flagellar motor switch protein FliN/FliY
MSDQEQAVEQENDLEQKLDDATDAVAVQSAELDELSGAGATGEPLGMDSLMGVSVRVTVQVGRTQLTLGELVELAPGSLIALDREAHEPADILVNDKVVARGEVVTIDNMYGVRITSVQKLG